MRHVTARLASLALLPALALAAATLPAHAGDGPLTLTVGSGSIQQFVPDLNFITRKLVVKKAGRITDLNVVVAAEHNAISDFSFMLRSPQGRVVHLSTNNGGNGDGYGSPSVDGCGSTMRFDDEAAENVADFDGVARIFAGGYQAGLTRRRSAVGHWAWCAHGDHRRAHRGRSRAGELLVPPSRGRVRVAAPVREEGGRPRGRCG
jgi:hypothetical protein